MVSVESDQAIISVRGLSKQFSGRTVVDQIDLTIRAGEIMGFLGPNGSGKTTTIRMICGLLVPDSGTGTCLGYDVIKESAAIKEYVGYMPQKFCLYGDLTVRENLRFFADVYLIPQSKQSIAEMIDRFSLGPYTDKLAGSLSGGWKQILTLACCLLHKPKLLLLDEPTAGVDPKARRSFWDMITLLGHQGITTLVSTHYMDEAERCHRLAYIAYGKLLAVGTVDEIVRRSQLKTFVAEGKNLLMLREDLKKYSDSLQASILGRTLRLTGTDEQACQRAMEPWLTQYHWREEPSTLEDVFILLVGDMQKKANLHGEDFHV